MKKTSSKKGFSLIELIVVIAVIAAIAAVIVPSISNFSNEAKITADNRNVQLWQQVYLEGRAAGATWTNTAPAATIAKDAEVPALTGSTKVGVGGTTVNFNAPKFTFAAGSGTFTAADGLTFVKPTVKP